MIDITGIDLVKFAKKVYEFSAPQGLGFLHYTPEPLSDDEAKQLVDIFENDKSWALDMDYVKGRACKMTVWQKDEKLEIHDDWFDHTDRIFDQLLSNFGIKRNLEVKHGMVCNCLDCQSLRAIES